MGVTIAITGASGYLGRKLLQALESADDVTRIVGIDVAEPAFSTRKLEFYRMDVRSHELTAVVRGADAIVHLAAIHTHDAAEVHDVNVTGTRAVVEAAERVDASRLVFASSHSVYGNHADNDYPLTEDSPVRPGHSNAYAQSKAEAERTVSYFAEEHPDVAVSTLRLAWVGGPTVPANTAIESPISLVIRGYEPERQALHEDDAGDALSFALRSNLRGVFNVCADDTVTKVDEVFGQRRVTVDLERAKRLMDRTSKLGFSPQAAEVGLMLYPQVMSNARIKAAGFTFTHSAAQTLRESAAARKEWVTIGRARFRPKRALLVGGTLGAVLLGSAARKRRKPEA